MQTIALLLILVPAPRGEPSAPELPLPLICGSWDATWGAAQWTVQFKADGTYSSLEYGCGMWWMEDDLIYFLDGGQRYVLQWRDHRKLKLDGALSLDNGKFVDWVDVKLTRRK